MKKLNLNGKMTGAEVGKIAVKDLLFRTNSVLHGNGDVSLFSSAEIKRMVANLIDNEDIREYNNVDNASKKTDKQKLKVISDILKLA